MADKMTNFERNSIKNAGFTQTEKSASKVNEMAKKGVESSSEAGFSWDQMTDPNAQHRQSQRSNLVKWVSLLLGVIVIIGVVIFGLWAWMSTIEV